MSNATLLSKMLVHHRTRRQGLGTALPRAAEDVGRDLRLYARLGWRQVGVIPGYALLPHGGLCDTHYFYRSLQ